MKKCEAILIGNWRHRVRGVTSTGRRVVQDSTFLSKMYVEEPHDPWITVGHYVWRWWWPFWVYRPLLPTYPQDKPQ